MGKEARAASISKKTAASQKVWFDKSLNDDLPEVYPKISY
jgi:hypothetical protein